MGCSPSVTRTERVHTAKQLIVNTSARASARTPPSAPLNAVRHTNGHTVIANDKPPSSASLASRITNKARQRLGAGSAKAGRTHSSDNDRRPLKPSSAGARVRDYSAGKRTAPQLSFAVLGKEEGVEVQPRANYLPPLEKTGDANQPAITRRPRPVDSAKILESLRQEGLLEETSKGVSGVSYELPLGELQADRRMEPPARLAAKLVSRQSREQSIEATKLKLKQRLEEAESRRLQRERDKQNRVRNKDEQNLHVKLSLLELTDTTDDTAKRALNNGLAAASTRRNAKMEQMLERQRQREAKAEEVRARRALNESNGLLTALARIGPEHEIPP